MSKTFLKAAWRKLALFNYEVDSAILKPFLPKGTELDLWNNTCYVSLVGFMFLNTRIKGFKIPFHTDFEEVNLRFYVRYNDKGSLKRGVVFIKEIVPKPALTFVANTIYRENYETLPMKHLWEEKDGKQIITYSWRKKKKWHSMTLETGPELREIGQGSEAEFITEHYWGYTQINKDKTSEYEVKHPKWQMYDVQDYTVDVDFAAMYGQQFAFLSGIKPLSVFLAEGSDISVEAGRVI
ncbi:DUF2071 domain-containing protein [Taibaiella lutea]|uniref:DUF2071 domain-containing protein n=1 Tax=Taibaiella lutea TaxID=2608001 RepID=A0A5M6CGR1_9BACT|nr:DUF2071 domain-containing protein [Taibaiella lutea]KAA5533620.1 DUF2071 domain-containing protein [Taibaiella lutea]